jgi:putative aldouronate transport system permease protein
VGAASLGGNIVNFSGQARLSGGRKAVWTGLWRKIMKNWELYLFLLPTLIYIIVFKYLPMYGVTIAFKNFNPALGIQGSPWVGLRHFERFFNSYWFHDLLRNTLALSVFQLVASFPMPIIVALMLNQVRHKRYKKVVQTVIYAPHFISTVVLAGIMFVFLSPSSGIVNKAIELLGGEPVFFMARPEWFRPLYVLSGIWQGTGFGTIVYLAALTSVPPELHEAAIVDGATKLQRIRYIDIPSIIPTAVILLILEMGNIMNIGFEKAYLMQTSLNVTASEIIPTYVYKVGLLQAQWSFSAAVGLFNAVINFILLITVNRIAKSLSNTSLW